MALFDDLLVGTTIDFNNNCILLTKQNEDIDN